MSNKTTAIKVLTDYQTQLDPEGIEVGVSRQALDDVIRSHECLESEIQSLKQELAEREWVSVENLPASGRRVIFSWLSSNGRRCTSTGFYAKKHDIEANHWDDCELADYIEEKDTYYCPEGWHEECHESEIFYPVTDNVTHWQPLPPSPKGE